MIMRQVGLVSFAAVIAVVGAFSANISTAQQPQQAKSLQFEAAAIRPSHPQPGAGSLSFGGVPGGQFRLVNMPLKQWVERALSVSDYALKSPSWLDTSNFDLDARMPSGAPADQKATGEMLKALLIERFGLKWHEELQSVSGFELVPDKKVLAEPSSLLDRLLPAGRSSGPTLITGKNMSMSELAGALGDTLKKPVVDATHLSGGFNIKLMWRPSDDAELARQQQYGKQYGLDVDNLPASVSVALREQLGLRLQSAKVPSKVIVVDNINRQPTGN